ncbi:MAG: glycosyltransferase family 4 protein [Nitrososphaerota archaeon]
MDKNIKVLFLSKYLNPSGVTTFMFTLGKCLIEKGFDVGIATDKETIEHDYSIKKFEDFGFRIYIIPFIGKGYGIENFKRFFKSLISFFQILKEYKPDIIHVHWRVTSLYAELAYRLFGIPYIVTLHLEGIPYDFWAKRFSFWGKFAIAISKETYNDLNSVFGIPVNKIKLIYNGVDNNYFRPPTCEEKKRAREIFNLSDDDKVVCLIGRLSVVKGHDILIKSAVILKRENIRPRFLLAGTGDFNYVKGLLKNFDIEDQFIFTGFTDSRNVLWASDILVLPSRKEGFPLVIVEAMLCGVVPIRTPAAGAYDQIDDGINGFIIPFEDSEALAIRIKTLLEDKELREIMAKNAIEKAKKVFTAEKMVESYINIYNDIINSK